MKQFYYLFFLIGMMLSLSACQENKPLVLHPDKTISTSTTEIQYFENFDKLAPLFKHQDDTLRVINFWATWCAPCVKEIPFFTTLDQEFKSQNKKSKVMLISLDLSEKNLVKFIDKNKINTTSYWLDDANANYWIGEIEKDWDGAIPVTLFIKGQNKKFHFGDFESLDDIKTIINSI
ncbi:redoxin domain-containing protein [Flammeovirga yaeyamensis]|uniref:Redoxin domain-containing protein n=1 Tax=Flammeovirga yaeyamensis TaxID=367791 RepID=A0AAX1NB89_9BACT|nr:TlpA disulfide reductase family protein [Flammeovirga yaeyamensis]MBB3699879.1 thiol-disulfide isomerase/thioredoxin [Flammeovirga yaeyamensis]NMF38324.1 TlpA family protein disulfide reductase [Flammeovirga yaeyamensis]QWG04735.1 redoxin domain-containing protein [Flammeovirga yaeyamensis]